MKIARTTDYAIRCLLHMASRPGGIFTVREFPVPGGSRGGFRLTRHPPTITLLSVIEAVEGPLAQNERLVEGIRCSRTSLCAVHPVWKDLRETLGATLKKTTLQQLVEREDAMNQQEYGMAGEGT